MSGGGELLLIVNPRDQGSFIKILAKNKPTVFIGLNTLFNVLANNPDFVKLDFSSYTFTIAGGMSVNAAVAKRWYEVTGVPVLEGYGLTEASPLAIINPVNISEFDGSIGMPIPSTEVELRDKDNNLVAQGEKGELWLRGPQVMKGYWNNAEATADVIDNEGWLRTGDIAYMDECGYFYLVDRVKDMILVSGFNVYPNEIEEILMSHPGVVEVAVVGVPSERTGEAVKAFIVKNDPKLMPQEIVAYCRERLTPYKVPKQIEFRDELPKSNVGAGMNLGLARNFSAASVPTVKDIIVNLFPSNPIAALMQGNMLQIIVFALLVGIAMAAVGEKAKQLVVVFKNLEAVLIRLVLMIMQLAPYGVFCLLATQFSRVGLSLIGHLLGYFLVVLLVLLIQLFGCYSLLLGLFGRLNPKIFFRKMYQTMLFAFSVSSSSASIPLVLNTVKQRLGVQGSIASFIVPLGATINMDGTAIMQGVATVFIAHAYHVSIGLVGYLTVIGMATLASIGTAGVPGVGMITLAMVLQQVGLPVEGIGLIIGIDRLLDMARTAVNISGDAMIACLVGKSEAKVDMTIYRDPTK